MSNIIYTKAHAHETKHTENLEKEGEGPENDVKRDDAIWIT